MRLSRLEVLQLALLFVIMANIERLVALGEKLQYEGEALQKFVNDELQRDEERRREEREERALQREEKKEQMLHEERMKQLELESQQMRLKADGKDTEEGNGHGGRVQAKTPKLPPFHEDKDNLDAYLGRFERYATVQKWPKDSWAINLSALLTGKALETYYRLHSDDIDNYDAVRDALLRRFEMTEEGFRTKFFHSKAECGESADQFMTRLENYLTRWMELSDTPKDFDGLWNLIVREQFTNACHKDLMTFLREHKLKSIKEVTEVADNYLLAHGGNLSAPKVVKKVSKDAVEGSSEKGHSKTWVEKRSCFKCGKQGHIAAKCYSNQNSQAARLDGHGETNTSSRNTSRPVYECFLCGRKGHVAKFCRQFDQKKTTAAVVEQQEQHMCTKVESQDEVRSSSPQNKGCCTCGGSHPACFISELQDVAADYDDTTFMADNGQEYSVCHLRCKRPIPICTCQNLPTSKAMLNGHEVEALRDTGCSGVVVRSEFVNPDQFTGQNHLFWWLMVQLGRCQ